MDVVALALAVVTAAGGATMLALWLQRGGNDPGRRGRLPLPGILGHATFAVLAIIALAVWVFGGPDSVGYVSIGLFVLAAGGGLAMFAGWLAEREETPGVTSTSDTPREQLPRDAAPEVRLPTPLVAGHGLAAVATIIVVVLAVLR